MHNVSKPSAGVVRDYLLGNLSDETRADVELRLLQDDQFFEELLISESELVDEYFAGRLSDIEKRQFQSHFLVAPERQAKFRFARVFKKYLESNDTTQVDPKVSEVVSGFSLARLSNVVKSYWPVQRPLVTVSVAVLVLVLAGITLRFWWQRGGGFGSRDRVVSVSLMPGLTRSGGATQRVEITPDVGTLQLELGLAANDFPKYKTELIGEAATIQVANQLKPVSVDGPRFILVNLDPPAAGDYQVKLSGVLPSGQLQALHTYYFRVIRR